MVERAVLDFKNGYASGNDLDGKKARFCLKEIIFRKDGTSVILRNIM
jgi:hypothetical protein